MEKNQNLHHLSRERLERMEALVNFVRKKGNATIDEVVGYMGVEYGLAERKVMEYLKQLAVMKKLTVDFERNIVKVEDEHG